MFREGKCHHCGTGIGSFYELSNFVPVDLCIPAFLDFSFAFPRSLIFPLHSRVPVRHSFRDPLCSRLPVLRFYAPVSKSVCVGGWVRLITRSLLVYGRIRRVGSTRHLAITPPRHTCAVKEYTGGKPVWGQTHISSTIPPFHLSSQYMS